MLTLHDSQIDHQPTNTLLLHAQLEDTIKCVENFAIFLAADLQCPVKAHHLVGR